MFDFVRKHTKIMMLFMFLLIIPAFALVGVDGYRRMSAEGAAVAKVASYSITQSQWDAAHKGEVDRMRASMPNLEAKVLESPEARYMTLERMVRERVMEEAMKDSLLNVSDARLAKALQQNPSIAALRKPDGTVDLDRYRQLAASQGLTPEGLEERVRHDMSLRQVETGLSASAFAPKGVADVALNAFFQRRTVQITPFKPSDFVAKITLSDADVAAFYEGNSALFQAPESLDVEYLVLDLDAVKKTISLADEDLRSYYEENVARLQAKEERRASHILINASKDMPAAQRQKAKELAQDLLLKVLEKPDTFAKVAAKFSQDPGSAAKGGDLDFFARGAMVKPFEDAAFAMRKGEISKLVESDFGYHIIALTDIKTPPKPSFESLRAGLEAELKTQQAQRKFAEAAETFSNGVYEQADSLKPMAERLKLEFKSAAAVQRKNAVGPLANPKLLAALFSPDAIEKKHNTEAVETGPNQLVAARVTAHHPARTLPLAEVRAAVKERLLAIRSRELAVKEGQARLTDWKDHPDLAKFPVAVEVSRQQGQSVSGPLLDALMRADTSTLPAWVGLDLGAQGYAVARVNAVLPRTDPDATAATQERAQIVQWLSGAESQAYYEVLKERFKVQIRIPRPQAGATLAPNDQ